MTTQPIYASLSRIKDEEVRTAVRLIADALERAGTRIVSVEQRPAIPATAIRQNLQVTGATPLNLVGLPGLPTVSIGVQKAGALLGTEPIINVIDGANITITVADDPGNSRVNLTIASAVALAVQKAGALIGTRPIINFTEDGNVTLTMADNPGATRVDIGVKALPGGAVAPFTKLWGWDWTTLNDFLLFKSSGADTLAACADVYTTDVNTENCIPYLDFYNPAGSAAVTHLMMLSNVTLSPASGHLLFIDLDVKTLTVTATTYGIVIAQGGSETDTFYQILLNHGGVSAAMNKYTAAAYQHQFNAIGIAARYQWKNAKILVNTSGAVIGGIPAGGLMLCNNGLLMWKKPMTLINATVLSGAVRVGLVLPGALGLKTNWLQMGRIEAYSVPPDFIQLLP